MLSILGREWKRALRPHIVSAIVGALTIWMVDEMVVVFPEWDRYVVAGVVSAVIWGFVRAILRLRRRQGPAVHILDMEDMDEMAAKQREWRRRKGIQ